MIVVNDERIGEIPDSLRDYRVHQVVKGFHTKVVSLLIQTITHRYERNRFTIATMVR